MHEPRSLTSLKQDDPLYILMGHRLYFPSDIIFLSLKIEFVLANSADCKNAAPAGSLLFLKYPLRDFKSL